MIEAYESDNSLKQFHSYHEGYYDYGHPDTPSQTRSEFLRGLDALDKTLGAQPNRSLFDVGFGNGFFLAVANKRGWMVDGIDSSGTNVEIAKKKFSLDLKKGSFDTADLPSQRYDAISFLDVVEHLPHPDKALEKAHGMLKPNGAMLIAVPNDDSCFSLLFHFLFRMSFGLIKPGLDKLYFYEHVSYFNIRTLVPLLKRNGFEYRAHFFSSTDLKKYSLSFKERLLAKTLLTLGKLTGRQNRLVAVFQKTSR